MMLFLFRTDHDTCLSLCNRIISKTLNLQADEY